VFQAGARSAGMAHASVTNDDIWASFHNQANLAFEPKLQMGFHAENRFYSRNLASGSFAIASPLYKGVFFSNISFYGFELYNEVKGGIGYTHQLFEKLSASVQFDYFSAFQNQNLGTSRAVTFELGLAGHITEALKFGAHLVNPTSAQFNNIVEYPLPSVVSFGASYKIAGFLFSSEIEKDFEASAVYHAGGEYELTDIIFVRAGVSNSFHSTYSFGLGFYFTNLQADFAFANHYILGFTPHFSLSYAF
jgi:hypothetical protein